MVKRGIKKKTVKKDPLIKKEAQVIARLILFVPLFVIFTFLTWIIPISTLETIFLGLAILTGIINTTLILILVGIILARRKK